jgi:hypothetical protein
MPAAQDFWLSKQIAAVVDQRRDQCPGAPFASVGYSEPSLVFLAGTETQFTSIEGAAVLYEQDPSCAIVAIPVDQTDGFRVLLSQSDITPVRIGSIEGFNYNGGKPVLMTVYSGLEN